MATLKAVQFTMRDNQIIALILNASCQLFNMVGVFNGMGGHSIRVMRSSFALILLFYYKLWRNVMELLARKILFRAVSRKKHIPLNYCLTETPQATK